MNLLNMKIQDNSTRLSSNFRKNLSKLQGLNKTKLIFLDNFVKKARRIKI